jgi:hypothetical protein
MEIKEKLTPEQEMEKLIKMIVEVSWIENQFETGSRKTECLYGNLRLNYSGRDKALRGIVNRAVKGGIVRIRRTGFGDFVVMTDIGKTMMKERN